MTDRELDELIAELRRAAAHWFSPDLHKKLERLIALVEAKRLKLVA